MRILKISAAIMMWGIFGAFDMILIFLSFFLRTRNVSFSKKENMKIGYLYFKNVS